MNPLISIIIINWNGKRWLDSCFSSLYKQTFQNFEIIFVDNNSNDYSIYFVQKKYPKVIVIKNNTNLGFAEGNNIGLSKATGKYILLLNNDTHADSDFLEKFVNPFENSNATVMQSKIILSKKSKKLDSCGSFWTNSGFLYHYGNGKDQKLEKYNHSMPIFSTKGASMMIRRDIIDKIGLFDTDFWNYYEETDFCHRCWIAGYTCYYYPDAIIYHKMGGTSLRFDNAYIQFHNFKNKLLSFIKNFEITTLIKFLPIYLLINIVLSIIWLIQLKPKHFITLYKAIWWNIAHLNNTLKKRKRIQALRKKSDKEIFKDTKKNPRLCYYYFLLTNLEKFQD